jgi:hypothetical protein
VNKRTIAAFSIRYVGLDVHKETIAVAVAGTGTAEPRVLGIIPNDSDALRALVKKLGRPSELRVCYEAGLCGYAIQHFLQRLGIDCVIALIPPGQNGPNPSCILFAPFGTLRQSHALRSHALRVLASGKPGGYSPAVDKRAGKALP